MRNFDIPDDNLIYIDDNSSQLETAIMAIDLIPKLKKIILSVFQILTLSFLIEKVFKS